MQRFPVAAEEYHAWYWKILRRYELEEQMSTENSEKKPAHMYLKTTHMEKSSNYEDIYRSSGKRMARSLFKAKLPGSSSNSNTRNYSEHTLTNTI